MSSIEYQQSDKMIQQQSLTKFWVKLNFVIVTSSTRLVLMPKSWLISIAILRLESKRQSLAHPDQARAQQFSFLSDSMTPQLAKFWLMARIWRQSTYETTDSKLVTWVKNPSYLTLQSRQICSWVNQMPLMLKLKMLSKRQILGALSPSIQMV